MPCPLRLQCDSYSKATGHLRIARTLYQRSILRNNTPFDELQQNIIEINPSYNKDEYVSHFKYSRTNFNIIYTYPSKGSDIIKAFRRALKFITKTLGYPAPRFIRIDGEKLGPEFEEIALEFSCQVDRTSARTSDQNRGSERYSQTIINKARAIRIKGCLPEELQPLITLYTAKIMNFTLLKKLAYKTL